MTVVAELIRDPKINMITASCGIRFQPHKTRLTVDSYTGKARKTNGALLKALLM
jgi:hypothetical protein